MRYHTCGFYHKRSRGFSSLTREEGLFGKIRPSEGLFREGARSRCSSVCRSSGSQWSLFLGDGAHRPGGPQAHQIFFAIYFYSMTADTFCSNLESPFVSRTRRRILERKVFDWHIWILSIDKTLGIKLVDVYFIAEECCADLNLSKKLQFTENKPFTWKDFVNVCCSDAMESGGKLISLAEPTYLPTTTQKC